ncbi:MAG: ABC transporter permease [Bryobacteraceae bacterium]
MRWDSWFKRRHWEGQMDAEFRFHLESQINDYVTQGLGREAAESRARREFGALELAKDECRDQRPVEWLGQIFRDASYACRSLRKNPGFAAAAVVTLALGIGANTAIFSVVHSVLLKPLPYSQPDEIYSIEVVIPERRSQFASLPVTVQAYLEWRKAETAFAEMSALRPWECSLTGDGEPERLGGARVSANFFSLLGVPIARGRGFSVEEEQPGNERVVVISDALWRRRYGADPALIGKSINVNGESHLVVGIAPPSLPVPTGTLLHPFLAFAPRIDLWKPIAVTQRELKNENWDHGLLVRLRAGENPEHGRQQLQAILNALIRAHMPGIKTELIAQLVPIREIYAGKVRLRLLLILAASALLLLTACVNIANLFLARMASRAGEFATRIALGAGRARILSHTLTETTLLAMLGGGLGAVIAKYGAGLLATYGPDDVRLLAGTPLNLPVFLFAMSASLATGIVCGIFPAWQAYRKDAATGLQEGARTAFGGGRAARFRQVLVGVEIALGTVLLASAGLLLHSFVKVMRADRGYQVERVLAVDLSLFGQGYSRGETRIAFYRELAGNVRALPGILGAGAISDLPASGTSGASQTIFHATDTNFQNMVLARPVAMVRSVTTGYFAASGSALRAGRFFTDPEQVLVAVVSESLANCLWPGEAPAAVVGRTLRGGNVTGPLITVCGVVEDVRPGAVDRELLALMYRPHDQWASGPMTLVVRTAQEPAALAPAVRAEIRKMDPNLPIPAIRTMREIVSSSVAQRRFQMMLTSLFAFVALLLGAVGVYGVVSYSVACRTRDIGLRIALGAASSDVVRWVLSHGMRPVLIGILAGLCGTIAAAKALRSLLFGIAPGDPVSLVAVTLVLLLTSGLACYLPARRAARLDPMISLRHG